MVSKNEKFAVIGTGGKQYIVRPGDKLRVEKIGKFDVSSVDFDKVLLIVNGTDVKIGNPYIAGAKIKAAWLEEKKGKKITMLKYKSKTREARKKGHRQIYTKVEIGDF